MTNMTTISNKAIEKIKDNRRVIGRLVSHFDKHYRTIEIWIDKKDVMLTTPDAVCIISQETGLQPEEILTEEKAVA